MSCVFAVLKRVMTFRSSSLQIVILVQSEISLNIHDPKPIPITPATWPRQGEGYFQTNNKQTQNICTAEKYLHMDATVS